MTVIAKFAEHCRCGGSMTGEIEPAGGEKPLLEIFWRVHSGPEHGPTTAEKARRVRNQQDRLAVR